MTKATKKRKPVSKSANPAKSKLSSAPAKAAPGAARLVVGDEVTRSTAFRRAAMDAESYARDPNRLRQLVEDSAGKISITPRGPFADTWPYLMAMIRLLRDYHRAEYRDISE